MTCFNANHKKCTFLSSRKIVEVRFYQSLGEKCLFYLFSKLGILASEASKQFPTWQCQMLAKLRQLADQPKQSTTHHNFESPLLGFLLVS